jgi:putative addiction module killer protein
MIEVREYIPAGRSASVFGEWFLGLDIRARQLLDDAIARMRLGNMGDCKRVGSGVLERRIDSGPGYRIYFGRDGDNLILLLAGSTKRRQQRAIAEARALWREYKQRKRKAN